MKFHGGRPPVILRFGKYRGHNIESVPEDYLMWLRASSETIVSQIDEELDRRQREANMRAAQASGCPVELSELVAELVSTGYKRSAQKYHPDVGGSDEDMKKLNKAVEWLRQSLGIQ